MLERERRNTDLRRSLLSPSEVGVGRDDDSSSSSNGLFGANEGPNGEEESVGSAGGAWGAEDLGVGEYFPKVNSLKEYPHPKMFEWKSVFIFRFGSMLFSTETEEEGNHMNKCFRNMFKEPENAKLCCVCQEPFESMIPLLFHVQHRCHMAIPCDLDDFVMQKTPIAYSINSTTQKLLVAMNKIFGGGEKLDILDPTAKGGDELRAFYCQTIRGKSE